MQKRSAAIKVVLLLFIMLFSLGNSVIPLDLKTRIDNVAEPLIDPVWDNVGVSVGITSKAETQSFGYGETVLGSGTKPDGATIFEIASITKPFTALLLADMVEDGLFMLDDPVENFLPGYVNLPEFGDRKINLEDLATHTSGLPNLPTNLDPVDPLNPYADYTSDLLYEFLSGYSLPREPGTLYEYSNLGAGLLGHALELHSGVSYEELLVNRICNHLGMDNTRVNLSPEQEKRFAQGYLGGWPVPHWDFAVLAPAGALRFTTDDMLKFLSANLGLTENDLSHPMALTHIVRHPTDIPGVNVCLGWHTLDYEDKEIIWHNGGTFGFTSFTGFKKENSTGVVLLSNSMSFSLDQAGIQILEILEDYQEIVDWALAVLNDTISLGNDINNNIMHQGIEELKQKLTDSNIRLSYVIEKIRESWKNGELDGVKKKNVMWAQLCLRSAKGLNRAATRMLRRDNSRTRSRAKRFIQKIIFLEEWSKDILTEAKGA